VLQSLLETDPWNLQALLGTSAMFRIISKRATLFLFFRKYLLERGVKDM